MTDIKFDTKVIEDVKEALEDHADTMFKQRKGRWMAIVELAHVERNEPGPDEEKSPSVKLRITSVEVATDDYSDERLREVAQQLYRLRTSSGTLDEAVGEHRAGDILRNGSGLLVSADS